LARKYTFRDMTAGMTTESMTDRWLQARMAAPVFGTLPSPVTFGRKSSRVRGATVCLPIAYSADKSAPPGDHLLGRFTISAAGSGRTRAA
jgi:hypothetical protein